LDLLRANAERNALLGVGIGAQSDEDCVVDVRACAWGELENFAEDAKFDIVLVSDVLYHQPVSVMRALAETMRALVREDGGIVYFAYHFRENLIHDAHFFELIDKTFAETRRVFEENADADENIWLIEYMPKPTHERT
jgi:predicted nicotinamide N-methyase